MASSKAEFASDADEGLRSGTAGIAAAPTAGSPPGSSPATQARKSPRSRTTTLFSSTLLRPRGKSVSHTRLDDWSRPVGGSEGLGCIYNSSMDSRERSQVLRSVTQLTKESTNDLTGAAAEAFSGNVTPGLSQTTRFFANFRRGSSNNVIATNAEAPPSYQQTSQLEGRRRSEGSIVSQTSTPNREVGSSSSTSASSSRPSLQISRTSFFSNLGATSSSTSASTSTTSVSISAFPRQSSCQLSEQSQQQQQQQSDVRPTWTQRRRSSGQFSATARQAIQSSRSLFGRSNGISEDDAADTIEADTAPTGFYDGESDAPHKPTSAAVDEQASKPTATTATVLDGVSSSLDARSSKDQDDDHFLHSRTAGNGDKADLKAEVAGSVAVAVASAAGVAKNSPSAEAWQLQQPQLQNQLKASSSLSSSLDPAIANIVNVPTTGFSTAPSTPLNTTDSPPVVLVVDDAPSSPPPSISRTSSSRLEAVTLSSTSSTTNIVTPTSSSTPNTTQASTAATTPSHSTLALAPHALSSDPPAALHTNSASSALSTPPGSQHACLSSTDPLNIQIPATQVETHKHSGGAASRTPPLTPPSSSGACRSPRSSISGALAHVDASHRSTVSPPSPPASSAHRNSTASSSRRDSSSNEPAVSLSPRSSVAVESPLPGPTSSTTSSGRVSFDLRRITPFGGFSTASKMTSSSKSTRASFSAVGNGQPPNAANTDSIRHASSPSAGSSSKFFSRISLPGGSHRGSTNESPMSSPENKPRSRFSSFGKIGRGGDAQTPTKGSRDLRNSMQPWASASTDVLGMGLGQTQGRDSLALAREEATRPRKSLHLPRSNLIDLDAEDTSDTTASASTAALHSEMTALPPIPTASIRTDKTVSPSAQSARRPSFNFLRRTSANSNNSGVDTANGERRGSFARTFMGRTFSRNSKGETPQDAANADATPHAEADPSTSRAGVFDWRASAFPGGVAYPGMSSTVNWNAPTTTQSPTHAEVAPNDVDPTGPVIPAYPGSAAAVNGTAPQPKSMAELASGVLAQRRPSQGIDEEQDAAEVTDSVADSLAPRGTSSTPTSAAASTSATAPRQRSSRSSHALSHLPRLDSMRAIPTASSADGTSNARARTGSEGTQDSSMTRDTSDEEQELSEDDEEGDMTGQTSDYHDLDDTETDEETDYDGSPVASRRMSAAPMAATGSSGGLNRNRPTESLVLPPAPTFIPNTSSPLASQGSEAAASTASGAQAQSGEFSQNVGRDTWTSFSASGFTPFETPTPRIGGGNAFNFSGPTPRARQELSESSYFTARPGTSNHTRASTAGTMSGDAPPPSPSIISRSRAPSSASMRTIRTPGASTMGSGPVPNRSMPAPVGALPPLALNRQISKVGIDRSKSPAQTPGSSRPSTSGTLTPLQGTAGEASRSRAPSIERPASERVASRQGQGAEAKTTPSPKPVLRPLVGLDGMSSSAARPNFYQQKSKSLVDLLGPASRRLEIDPSSPIRPTINEPVGMDALRTPTTPRPLSEVPAYSKRDGLAPIDTSLTASASIASPGAATLGRRRSMFEMRAEPPGYSIIHNRPEGPQIILPREEEGHEKLPGYCCGVHIEGYLPRKMEFSAPGVQAKDRSWKRQYFVLHGTSLRVYKNDLSVDRHAANGTWGEMKGVHVHLEPMNEDGSNGSGSGIGLGAAAREAISHTPLGAHRHDSSKHKEATTFDSKNGLLRNYTLQGAESGLAADYLKRRHVVRVRAEGEQFLLQTRSDRHVVDWIEALQAATNVAVDLEKRPMPKFITLPRRRRRRRRNADGTVVNPEEQEARDLAEAQRRSMADVGGSRGADGSRSGAGGGVGEATPRDSMSQRPSVSLENELNPSAAFERMLREDQEQGGRQSAAVM